MLSFAPAVPCLPAPAGSCTPCSSRAAMPKCPPGVSRCEAPRVRACCRLLLPGVDSPDRDCDPGRAGCLIPVARWMAACSRRALAAFDGVESTAWNSDARAPFTAAFDGVESTAWNSASPLGPLAALDGMERTNAHSWMEGVRFACLWTVCGADGVTVLFQTGSWRGRRAVPQCHAIEPRFMPGPNRLIVIKIHDDLRRHFICGRASRPVSTEPQATLHDLGLTAWWCGCGPDRMLPAMPAAPRLLAWAGGMHAMLKQSCFGEMPTGHFTSCGTARGTHAPTGASGCELSGFPTGNENPRPRCMTWG